MKRINLILIAIILLTSCSVKVSKIGEINMISNRNIDFSKEYKLISAYTGGSYHELKRSRALSVQDAVDETVKKIPGGDFLMNVKIYLCDGKYIAIEGDVWGMTNDKKEVDYKGMKIGDHVTWKSSGKYKRGVIKGFKDAENCIVSPDDDISKLIEIRFDKLTGLE